MKPKIKQIIKTMKENTKEKAKPRTAEDKGMPLAPDFHEQIQMEDQSGVKVIVSSSIYSVFDLTDLAFDIRKRLKKNNGSKGHPSYTK